MTDLQRQQFLLRRLGYSSPVDGQDSLQHTRSVKAFQRDLQREVTGVLSDDDLMCLHQCVRNRFEKVSTYA